MAVKVDSDLQKAVAFLSNCILSMPTEVGLKGDPVHLTLSALTNLICICAQATGVSEEELFYNIKLVWQHGVENPIIPSKPTYN